MLVSKLEGYSRTQIKTLILNGNVCLDEKEIKDPSYITKENENYLISIILKQETKHSAENIDLNIIFEDEDLIVINKPPNLVMHPAPGNESGTLVNALMHYTNNQLSNLETNFIDYNLNLEKGHNITDIDMIDNNRILFTIKNNDKVYALIYDIETSDITKIDTSNE